MSPNSLSQPCCTQSCPGQGDAAILAFPSSIRISISPRFPVTVSDVSDVSCSICVCAAACISSIISEISPDSLEEFSRRRTMIRIRGISRSVKRKNGYFSAGFMDYVQFAAAGDAFSFFHAFRADLPSCSFDADAAAFGA